MSMYENGMPYMVKVKKGETTFVCQCGHSKTPPYCDGSHGAHPTGEPLHYKAEKDETIRVCGCGKTGSEPMCDGSHNRR
jgi:CDGSH-type Zn-finger protein